METITLDEAKRMTLPDLRKVLRERGLQPAGGIEALKERLTEYLTAVASGACESRAPGTAGAPAHAHAEVEAQPWLNSEAGVTNNYSRPEGQARVVRVQRSRSRLSLSRFFRAQNTGNYLTGRNSSRVSAPPGGQSSIVFGESEAPKPRSAQASAPGSAAHAAAATAMRNNASSVAFGGDASAGPSANNYARPESQNVGNFMTDRSSSRVSKPPGGASSITFG